VTSLLACDDTISRLEGAVRAKRAAEKNTWIAIRGGAECETEAPASVNFHTTLAGRQVQITLRDTDETRLLARLETLLQRFPVVEEPKESAQKEGWCYKHNVQMKLNHGKRGSWWSHKLPNGQWCNQK
jgi:hypothetical protein